MFTGSPNQLLADAIFHLRGRRTQEVFAREVGVTKRTIIRWEQGDTAGMRLAHAERLKELGIAPELLLGGPSTGSIVVAVAPRHGGDETTDSVPEVSTQANPAERGVA